MEINLPMLANQPFLTGLAERHLKVLLEHSMPAAFKTDEYIFYEGDPANRFYLLLEGRVSVESPVE
ncbi:MAG TPA: cyclic nucleotide-binding domain-containing protein, partial [Candidatus Baltobacteraceae bacterium]|nr:cyclic nucleotide-binding domain-containing protein [Candidatus Baltobacteraceae bacterium]